MPAAQRGGGQGCGRERADSRDLSGWEWCDLLKVRWGREGGIGGDSCFVLCRSGELLNEISKTAVELI